MESIPFLLFPSVHDPIKIDIQQIFLRLLVASILIDLLPLSVETPPRVKLIDDHHHLHSLSWAKHDSTWWSREKKVKISTGPRCLQTSLKLKHICLSVLVWNWLMNSSLFCLYLERCFNFQTQYNFVLDLLFSLLRDGIIYWSEKVRFGKILKNFERFCK